MESAVTVLGTGITGVDEVEDLLLELDDRREGAAANGLPGEDVEPALHRA